LFDTSGNVWELVRDINGRGFVTRGGCYYTTPRTAHLANRQAIPANVRHVLIGVRICASVE
jgi:formylglycine-generating enzyme required for sulfatase activity